MDNSYKIITFSKTEKSLFDYFIYLYQNSLFHEPRIKSELISLTSSTSKQDRIVLLNKIIIKNKYIKYKNKYLKLNNLGL